MLSGRREGYLLLGNAANVSNSNASSLKIKNLDCHNFLTHMHILFSKMMVEFSKQNNLPMYLIGLDDGFSQHSVSPAMTGGH